MIFSDKSNLLLRVFPPYYHKCRLPPRVWGGKRHYGGVSELYSGVRGQNGPSVHTRSGKRWFRGRIRPSLPTRWKKYFRVSSTSGLRKTSTHNHTRRIPKSLQKMQIAFSDKPVQERNGHNAICLPKKDARIILIPSIIGLKYPAAYSELCSALRPI